MASKRRGGFRTPELRGTLGTLLRTTTDVVRDALERGASAGRDALERGATAGRSRLDDVRTHRRRHDALAELGEIVLDLIRRGEVDLAELPEARDLIRQLDTFDAELDDDDEPAVGRAITRRRFDDRAAEAQRHEPAPTSRHEPALTSRHEPAGPNRTRRDSDQGTVPSNPRYRRDNDLGAAGAPRRRDLDDGTVTSGATRGRDPDDRALGSGATRRAPDDRAAASGATRYDPGDRAAASGATRYRRDSDDGTVASGASRYRRDNDDTVESGAHAHRDSAGARSRDSDGTVEPGPPRRRDSQGATTPTFDAPNLRRDSAPDTITVGRATREIDGLHGYPWSDADAPDDPDDDADSRATRPTTPARPRNNEPQTARAPTRPIKGVPITVEDDEPLAPIPPRRSAFTLPHDPHRKGGISFDDDDLNEYMHPDDVPPKGPAKDPDGGDA